MTIKGLLEFSLGDVESAIECFEIAINETSPPKAVAHYLKGLAYAVKGKIAEASN